MSKYQIVGIDTGGTFVDFVALDDEGRIKVFKIPSTPSNPSTAVMHGIKKLKRSIEEIVHGTTVATNAVLERKGAKVALFTTKGFADVIEIGRQNRRDIYQLIPSRPEPLVPRNMRFEVNERVLANKSVESSLDLTEIKKIKIPNETEAVAVCFLFSFFFPDHELRLKDYFNEHYPEITVSTSFEVLPEYREYERFSTTVMDAYVKPLMKKYLSNLVENVSSRCEVLSIMKSSAGLATPSGLLRKPVETLVSGLAGGILAAEMCAELTGRMNLISVDIGGTSTDVAQITDGKASTHRSIDIDGLPIGIEAVDVKTIGAGGGSIAQVKAGLLRVGPESAAGNPGPAAYNMGGENATVTDADLLYGILGQELAGGILKLDKEKAKEAIDKVGKKLETDFSNTVKGIRTVFHENIAAALRNVSTDRGVDPRDYTLVAFGGAGPVHAAELAEILGITSVLIPPHPGTWSAVGLLSANYRYDMSRGVLQNFDIISLKEVERILDELEQQATKLAMDDGILEKGDVIIRKSIDLRYQGQSYEITIPFATEKTKIRTLFFTKHREVYGFATEDEPIELVTLRLSLEVQHTTPTLRKIDVNKPLPISSREVLDIGEVPVYLRKDIGFEELKGPLIIDQLDSTTWVPPGWKTKQDQYGFMIMEVQQ